MKKSILTLLVLFVCAIQTTTAYEYFTIYFSDGTKSEAFYATDVDSICYSKIGLDSIAYDDWQVQEIYTCDSVYRYPLVQIDSLSFKDVDENKIAEDISRISSTISPIYGMCNSTKEISTHLSDIKSIEGVETAWVDNQALFVKIKDFGTVSYLYPPQEKSIGDNTFTNALFTHAASRAVSEEIIPAHDRIDAKKVCIVNQQFKDECRGNKKYVSKELEKYCNQMGLYPKKEEHPLPKFYENDIYNYDVVLLMTHGIYDENSGLHWMATSDELCVTDKHGKIGVDSLAKVLISRGYYKKYSTKDIIYTCIPEVRNGDSCQVYYTNISNLFISKQKKTFDNYGNVIVFNTACQSLKGNYNLANAFGTKGARAYLGYDESNQIGTGASFYYLLRLLNGQSTEQAFITLPSEWKEEKYEFPEKSGKYIEPHLIHAHNTNFGIVSPQTLDAEFSNDIKIKGNIKILNPYGEEAQNNGYGFLYSEFPNMNNCVGVGGELDYNEQTHNVTVEYTFKEGELKPNTTYYYCAYMNDGYSDCYGEVKSFCTQVVPYVMSFHNDEDNTYTSVYLCDGKIGESWNWNRVEEIAKKYGLDPTKYEGSVTFCDSDGNFQDTRVRPLQIHESSCIIFDPSFANFKPKTTYFWFTGEVVESINNIQYLNTERLIDMSCMFWRCSSLKHLDLSGLNTSKVTDMSYMFYYCSSLKSVDLSGLNTSKVTDMSYMFDRCSSLESVDLSSFDTSNVMDMNGMFHNCSSLKNLNLSNFDTNNVTSFQDMFAFCRKLETLDISNFVISNSTGESIDGIFGSCLSLTKIIFKNGKLKNARFNSSCFRHYSDQPTTDEFPPLDFDMENLEVSNGRAISTISGCNNIVSLNLSHLHKVDSIDSPIVSGCSSLKNVNLSYFSAPVLSKISTLFDNCASLESVDMSNMSIPNSEMLGGQYSHAMFYKCNALSYINLDNLYAPRTQYIHFSDNQYSIKIVNICNINAPNLKRVSFSGSSLEKIYVDNTWDNVNLDRNFEMFRGCNNLVGGKGTKIGKNLYGYDKNGNPLYYNCPHDERAAHIDGGKDNPGLFTAK